MASAVDEIPGYFVGPPLHPNGPPPQARPAPVARPAAGDRNVVTPHVPGYYSYSPIQPRPPQQPAASTDGPAPAAPLQGNRKPGWFSRWFGGCFSGGGNGS